jgi:2-dehydro-3-deoxy-D-gluconate 5-dehydrogenase
MNIFSLEGKTALVTGCNRGLGLAIATGLAEAGADIVGVYRSQPGDAPAAVVKTGRKFHPIQADLMNRVATESIMRSLKELRLLPTVLVNNAGTIRRAEAVNFKEQDWDEVLEVNTSAPFFLSRALASQWIEAGVTGKVINIASMLSYQGGIRVSSYTASKHAIQGLTRILANEWAPLGFNVNAIAPGYMATDNTEALRNDKQRFKEIVDRIPYGRWGEADDLIGAAVFLASSASNYICGHTIVVDGGWLSR